MAPKIEAGGRPLSGRGGVSTAPLLFPAAVGVTVLLGMPFGLFSIFSSVFLCLCCGSSYPSEHVQRHHVTTSWPWVRCADMCGWREGGDGSLRARLLWQGLLVVLQPSAHFLLIRIPVLSLLSRWMLREQSQCSSSNLDRAARSQRHH